MSNYIPLEWCKFFGIEDEICYGEVNFIENRHAGTRFSPNEIYCCEGHKSGKYISKKIIEEIESMPREIRRLTIISLCRSCDEDRKFIFNQFCNYCFKYDPEFLCKCHIIK
jgi:hypothetical protein